MLIGADGIWSKVRTQLIGHTDASYSGYTCYTGISDFVCPDIDTVAYRVFLGNGQYFVSSDVGGGKMQWYAFHEEPAGGKDEEGKQKQRLMKIFGHWYVLLHVCMVYQVVNSAGCSRPDLGIQRVLRLPLSYVSGSASVPAFWDLPGACLPMHPRWP